jgi:uncharacterized protein YjbJ (UPF0337 family)
MGTTKQRIKGAVDKASGTVKKTVGRATKNRSLEAEGHYQKTKGSVRGAAARTASRAKGAVQEVKGSAEQLVGEQNYDRNLMARGKKNVAKGRIRQKLSK